MDSTQLIINIESLIFASDKPLSSSEIQTALKNKAETEEKEFAVTIEEIEESLQEIVDKYASENYPFEVKMSGGGWQFLTKANFHNTIACLQSEKKIKRLSSAAMEVLSIVAYKTPITKTEIESLRTVNCDYAIQKLLEKDLIVISGRHDHLPGQPLIYAPSPSLLDYLGINTVEELPMLNEIVSESLMSPTLSNYTPKADDEDALLTPTETENEAIEENSEIISNEDLA